MLEEMEKFYDPKSVENKWYNWWVKNGFFHAVPNQNKRPFTIVIPPPNITGVLTMGHVLNNTIQDILIRQKRMQGYETLWMPGTDHAGIATNNVVEKEIAKQGLTRNDLGREKFVERVWQWREQYGSTIIRQLKVLGCSCDWERERFTMDEGLSKAVQEVFVTLYEKGLIYRGKYVINWCPRCQTALSDEEVEHEEEDGLLWYIKYSLKDGDGYVTVATTRPETMLGDVAVAVHPEDERYKQILGRVVVLPIIGREMRIIADDFVDPNLGTGAVKVTPAHDPNDFWVGQRHNLEPVLVMNEDGTMNENAGKKYAGMDRFKCRQNLVEDLKSQGLLEKIEKHLYAIGHCYRCNTIIEPYLSDQWFVKMNPLAQPAIEAVRKGIIRFFPERWINVYMNWMENIRDWPISRQIWWGHRIPVWYCGDCGEIFVSRSTPDSCAKCASSNLQQDEDTLDTWFSSWLWPFSTMGWPGKTDLLEYFYPTDVLVTAPDIIFFWVARMIMAGYEFMGENPFRDVYIHSIIRDAQGRKMSKSLGNSPDPLDVINVYGADALRFTLMMLAPQGQDILYSNEKVEIGRNFANKIWNATRFVMMNLEGFNTEDSLAGQVVESADRWIKSRLERTVINVTDALSKYRFDEASRLIYDFLWHDYCDWYLELVKSRLQDTSDRLTKLKAQRILIEVLEKAMRLLHPFMPFITEEIWQKVDRILENNNKELGGKRSIMIAPWSDSNPGLIDETVEREMFVIQQVIVAVRNIRSEMNVPPSKKADVMIRTDSGELTELLKNHTHYITDLAKVTRLEIGGELARPKASASAVITGAEIFVPLEGLIDLQLERERLEKEIKRISVLLTSLEVKLKNEDFLKRAPAEVVDKERRKSNEYKTNLEKLQKNLEAIL